MDIYVVKILNSVENNYQGLDDVQVYVCSNYRKAINKLSDIFYEKIQYFKKEYDMELYDEGLKSELTGDYQFSIHNNRDYFYGKVEKHEIEIV